MSYSVLFPRVADYELRQEIGGGGFSKVYSAFRDGQPAACKVIPLKKTTTPQERKSWNKEIQVHGAMKHPNVLEFLASLVVETQDDQPEWRGEGGYFPAVYMLLELATGGDLFDKISPNIGVTSDLAHLFFCQLIDGVSYLHTNGISHRDLKPENLLLGAHNELKISDFGLCSVFSYKGKIRLLQERCGSLPYVAPELNGTQPYRAEPIDVWGCGVILFTLLVGNTPWDEPTYDSPEFSAFVDGSVWGVDPWSRITGQARALLRALLTIDPEKRISVLETKAHPWVSKPSQLTSRSPAELAKLLAEGMEQSGAMDIVEPEIARSQATMDVDDDRGDGMPPPTQFETTLMLFSQTNTGQRYIPHLTRFYTSLPPDILAPLIDGALRDHPRMQVQTRESPLKQQDLALDVVAAIRVGGIDERREKFVGRVEIEPFMIEGLGGFSSRRGSFCLLKKEEGSPLSWKLLWKHVVQHPALEPYVCKKGRPIKLPPS